MPRYLITFLLCVFSLSAFAQKIAIETEYDRHEVYSCVENSINIVVQGHKPKSFFITTDNGIIRQDDNNSRRYYYLMPRKPGLAKIYVKEKKKSGLVRIIDSVSCRVKRMPLSQARIFNKTGGECTKTLVCNFLIAPSAVVECCGFDAKFSITGFTITVYRNEKEIFTRKIIDLKGARVDSVTKVFFYTLQDKDSLIFTDIETRDWCDKEIRYFDNSIRFSISEAEKYHVHKHGEEEEIIDPVTGQSIIKKW